MMTVSPYFETFSSLLVYYPAIEGGPLVLRVPKPMPEMKTAMIKPRREALRCWKAGGVVIPVRITWLVLGGKLT